MNETTLSPLSEETELEQPLLDPAETARAIVRVAEDKKAEDILMLDIRRLSTIADYFVICSGTSDRQVRAIVNGVQDGLRALRVRPLHIEGLSDARWVLLDYGDVILHVFAQKEREYYNLEKMWSEAPTVVHIQ